MQQLGDWAILYPRSLSSDQGHLDLKMPGYWCRDSCYKDKTVIRPPYLLNGNSNAHNVGLSSKLWSHVRLCFLKWIKTRTVIAFKLFYSKSLIVFLRDGTPSVDCKDWHRYIMIMKHVRGPSWILSQSRIVWQKQAKLLRKVIDYLGPF